MTGYAAVQSIMQYYKISIEVPCRFCGELTRCSCGCCHSSECNNKRGNEFSNNLLKFYKEEK